MLPHCVVCKLDVQHQWWQVTEILPIRSSSVDLSEPRGCQGGHEVDQDIEYDLVYEVGIKVAVSKQTDKIYAQGFDLWTGFINAFA